MGCIIFFLDGEAGANSIRGTRIGVAERVAIGEHKHEARGVARRR